MIITTENGDATRTDKIGAEPISIDSNAFEREIALDDLDNACREFIAARDSRPGTNMMNSLFQLNLAVKQVIVGDS